MPLLIRCMWAAYDLAYLVNNMRTYAQIGYSIGVTLRLGVDTLIGLL